MRSVATRVSSGLLSFLLDRVALPLYRTFTKQAMSFSIACVALMAAAAYLYRRTGKKHELTTHDEQELDAAIAAARNRGPR